MSEVKEVRISDFRREIPEFARMTEKFHNGEVSMKEYKGFSGKYGSYAQRGGKKHMLRLRMTAGRLTKEKMRFIAEAARKYQVPLLHFTTCQTVQMHDVDYQNLAPIMDEALDAGIVCYGGGGDYPRNVMCSPLAGTEEDEYFNVMPYAQAAADFLLHFIDGPKMPRKLKVGFSGSAANLPHATFRDLGFAAREDGLFDVYIAGGLGSNPRFGVLAAEGVKPDKILYYIEAMIRLFRKYGNYENRARARTRYLQDTFESPQALRDAYQKELDALFGEEDLTLGIYDPAAGLQIPDTRIEQECTKQSDGSTIETSWRVKAQKQPGLYAVRFHPAGGSVTPEEFSDLYALIRDMEDVEIRLAPDETAWIINLTGREAEKVLEATDNKAAKTPFESSVSCIGASICQVGLRDSQSLLARSIQAVREAGIAANALPQIHISGCPSSCGTHQIGALGFRGAIRMVDKKPQPAFVLYAGGDDRQGEEKMGREIGTLLEEQIPGFLVTLGKTVQESGLSFEEWMKANPEGLEEAAAPYLG